MIFLITSCSKYGDFSINGVRITESTVWQDIINDDDEKNVRAEIRQTAESLLVHSRFDELDKTAEDYRVSRLKFKNGEWALTSFYAGLTDLKRSAARQEEWESRLARLREWVAERPNSVTARVALSDCLVGYAFHNRGYGYVDTVTEERMQLFEQYMNEARSVLNASVSMRDECPEWRALVLVMGEEDWDHDEYLQAFRDAIAFNPEFSRYYFLMSRLLMPRWYGAEGELEEFWKMAADAVGGVDGDMLYAQMIWGLDKQYELDYLAALNPKVDWLRVKRGIEALSS
jgi:hypothetical protein